MAQLPISIILFLAGATIVFTLAMDSIKILVLSRLRID